MRIWHNPRCRKSRAALEFFKSHNISLEIYEYLEESLELTDLKEVLLKLDTGFESFIRKSEEAYKLYVKNKDLHQEDILKVMLEHPKLIQRPIIETDKQAFITRDEKSLDECLQALQ